MKAMMPGVLLVGAAAAVLVLLGRTGAVTSAVAMQDDAIASTPPATTSPAAKTEAGKTDAAKTEADKSDARPSPGRLLQSPEAWSQPFLKRPTRVIPRSLTPQMTDELLGVVKDIDPDVARRFDELRTKDAKKLEHKLLHANRLFNLLELKKADPALYQLKLTELRVESEVNRLKVRLRAADRSGSRKEFRQIRAKLQAQLKILLAFSHQARVEYVCRLQDAVKRLEDEVDAQREFLSKHVDEIVDERIAEMLRGAPSSGRPPEYLKLSSRPASEPD